MRNLNITKQVEELDESINVAKKPSEKNIKKTKKNVERLKKITKRNENKEARLNRRADRLAARKGFEGSGVFNEDGKPNNQSLMQARAEARKLMKDRRAKGKQFFVDMAKNLGGIDNAYETKPLNNPMTADEFMAKLGIMNKKSDVITEDNSQEQIEATNIAADNLEQDENPVTYMQKEYRKKRGY